jgi:hypothetical protein
MRTLRCLINLPLAPTRKVGILVLDSEGPWLRPILDALVAMTFWLQRMSRCMEILPTQKEIS